LITRITGRLIELDGEAATIEAGAFEYEVYVPEFVRRQLQKSLGETVRLRTIEYLEGNPQKGRMIPRMVGFTSDAERQFFDLVCSVDGVGVKKALRAMIRPVREVATAIEESDVKTLSTLPGVGGAVAERIVAKLRRKMAKFALLVGEEWGDEATPKSDLAAECHGALVALGHTERDAREKVETLLETGKKFKSVDEMLRAIYQRERE
jgi:holliday junction DNA helicase RuvA